MKLADLSPELIEKIKMWRYDHFIEKHEGPEDWSSVLRFYEPEILQLGEYQLLLPIGKDRHPNISAVNIIPAMDERTLTVFLKDTTFVSTPEDEMFEAGRLAICEKMPDADFYIAIVYHEWFMVKNEGLGAG